MIAQARKRLLLISAALILLVGGAYAIQTAVEHHRAAVAAAAPAEMAQMLPAGALLTIESPDFAGLLGSWNSSQESSAWLKSANYSAFANSRLFSRLSDAQDEFASTAGLKDAGTTFLQSIAGRESIFAWYDIGNLQFLYITRMTPARAAQTELLRRRTHFERRQAGANVFYVKTKAGSGGPSADRTVAFATLNGMLLLATREDLMANALALIGHGGGASVATEPWYTEASYAGQAAAQPAAQPAAAARPDLHMALNLDRLVPSPYFRSYWVQRNVSEMKQYRAAVADLYREPDRFREERTILLKAPPEETPDPDLAPLVALVPSGANVFHAAASPDPATLSRVLDEKLFGREIVAKPVDTEAPEADLSSPATGDAEDLETRIDTPAPVSASASTDALVQAIGAAGLDGVLTVDTTGVGKPGALWQAQHAAVALRTERSLEPGTLLPAVQAALRGSLTTTTLGLELKPESAGGHTFYVLNGPRPFLLAVEGRLCLLSDDRELLTAMLGRISASQAATPAVSIAGFDHAATRVPFARLTSLIEHTPAQSGGADKPDAPAFFSGNIASLSDAFQRLSSERITTRHEGQTLRQTVLYQWLSP